MIPIQRGLADITVAVADDDDDDIAAADIDDDNDDIAAVHVGKYVLEHYYFHYCKELIAAVQTH